jgi:hypothetical protein
MNWVVGQRVSREEAPEQLGTVSNVTNAEIKVVLDDGTISYHQTSAPISLIYARMK